MFLQVTLLDECVITLHARIRFLTSMGHNPFMDYNVFLHTDRSGQCFITLIACIWFLNSMHHIVFLQAISFYHMPCRDEDSRQFNNCNICGKC